MSFPEEPGPTHPLHLGKRWGDHAEENIDRWGNQYPATLLLAMAEELGEIAQALLAQTDVGDVDAPGARRGRRLLHELAGHGIRTRAYLEETFEDPAGKPQTDPLITGRDIAGQSLDVGPVLEETDDLAPLLWQLHWALEEEIDDE